MEDTELDGTSRVSVRVPSYRDLSAAKCSLIVCVIGGEEDIRDRCLRRR